MTILRFLVLISITIPCISLAQFSKVEYYNDIDNKVFVYSKKENQTFDSVVAFVNNNFKPDEDKVRAFYTWIALNVSYDTERLHNLETMSLYNVNGTHNFSQEADTVFKRRVGVCEGFCNLMNKFCSDVGIISESVPGYTKMPDGKVVTTILHVWNVVKVDHVYGLLDITWSNGYINQDGNFVKAFSDKYFLSTPKNFIKDHYPFDPMWQLLKYPISFNIFKSDSLYFPENKVFNYLDSIKVYNELPLQEKEYTKYLHYYLTDSSNILFAKNLDIFINNIVAEELISAEMYYDDYIIFHNATLIKNPTKSNFKKAREFLNGCKKNHEAAKKALLKKRANTTDYAATFTKMNAAIIEQEKQVQEQFDYLKKVEKTIKPK